MRVIKRILVGISILIVLLAIFLFLKVKSISNRALPDYTKAFVINNLTDSVRIYRDSFAVPHVYAKNKADLYRVTGYLVAQDRLWQMDLLRRVTMGRLSEIFGESFIDADMLMRALRISDKARKLYQEADPDIKQIMEAFSDGINQYINQHLDQLPPEFALLGYKPDLWKPEHSYNLIGYIAWDLNGSWISEIVLHKLKNKLGMEAVQDLIPAYDSTQSVIFTRSLITKNTDSWGSSMIAACNQLQNLGLAVFHGSNNWTVGPSRSASGKPILANDMHLGLFAPGIWYQMHQVIDGQLNVTGVMLPGAPFIISGHNDKIAWGMTNVMNDDIDFYQEEINPSDSNQYKINGEWKNMELKKETFHLKGGDSITRTIRFTRRGPVVSQLKGISNETISMRWVGNEPSNEVRTVYRLNYGANWNDFKEAVRTFVAISQNIVFADTAGNIGLYCSAGVPERKGPAWDVHSGNTGEYDWKGMVPFDSLPHAYNPSSGKLVSANNKTAEAGYPYYISCWYDLPYRYNRISHLLDSTRLHTPETFKEIQTDQTTEQYAYYLPALLETLKGEKLTDNEKKAFAILSDWKGNTSANSQATAIYEMFFVKFIETVFKDEMGPEIYQEFLGDKVLIRNAIHNIWRKKGSVFCDDIATPRTKETFNDMIVRSYKLAILSLEDQLGRNPVNWKWGDIHHFELAHPLGKKKIVDWIFHLNKGRFAVGGSFHTVEPYSYKYTAPFNSTNGASQRHIYSVGNWDDSWVVIPTGISGIPASPYYCDQTQMYVTNQYKHDWFSADKVRKYAKYSVLLTSSH